MSTLLDELNGLLGGDTVDTAVIDRLPEPTVTPSVRVVGQDTQPERDDRGAKFNSVRNDEFDSLYTRIMGLKREDYAVPANNLQVGLVDNSIAFRAGEFGWSTTGYAVDQLSDNLSKGLRSFGHELEGRGHKDLRVRIINEMLERESEKRKFQVRTIQPNGTRLARAVVSDSYKSLDDNLLIDPMIDLVGDRSKEWRALGGQITDVKTRIKYMTREPQIRNVGPRNRDWYVGWMYENSEVGAGSVKFSLFVFDSFCENGCVFGSQDLVNVNIMHKGTKIRSDFGLIAEDRVREAERLAVQQSVANATKEVLSMDFTKRIKELVEVNMARKLEGNTKQQIEAVKQVANFAGLTKAEQETVLVHWDTAEPTAFGVSSAVTRLAQDAEDYESRIRLEVAGGKVLEMQNRQWKSVMALAT